MDRAAEMTFAWALLDEAAAFLATADRVQLCVRIGAGEYRETILSLLQRFVANDVAIPPTLTASLWAWMNGFSGSAFEPSLRELTSRMRVSAKTCVPE